jgi:peptide chain release factor subunit 1
MAAVVSLGSRIPESGVMLFCDGAEDELVVCVPPEGAAPVSRLAYFCGKTFQLDDARAMVEPNPDPYAVLVVDGKEALVAVVGKTVRTLCRYAPSLPNKHNKGGQSSNRFQHLRENARHAYVSKVIELLNAHLSPLVPALRSLFVAGSADLKDDVLARLRGELHAELLARVDRNTIVLAQGGAAGLQEAVRLCAPRMALLHLAADNKVLEALFSDLDNPRVLLGPEAQEALAATPDEIERVIVADDSDQDLPPSLNAERTVIQRVNTSTTALGNQFKQTFGGLAAYRFF